MDYLHWGVDPVLLHLGPLSIRWYGLFFVGGLLIGLKIMEWIYKREGLDSSSLDNFLLYLIIGIVVGARLAHTLIYEPDYFLSHPIEILYVWRGGLASHGGTLGAVVATYFYSKRYNIDFLWVISRITIPGALVATFIRIGNFFNSEIVGKESSLPWAVVFERVDNIPRDPVQIYEAVSYLIIFFILLFIYHKTSFKFSKKLLGGLFLTAVFGVRFLLELFKMRQADYTLPIPFTVGQLLSVPFIVFGILWVIYTFKQN